MIRDMDQSITEASILLQQALKDYGKEEIIFSNITIAGVKYGLVFFKDERGNMIRAGRKLLRELAKENKELKKVIKSR
ncbi:MAG: hypothetical protein ACJ748_01270 [Flavisolibacter sp.]